MINPQLYEIFPVIDLGDIVLRDLYESDAQNYFEYMSRPEMADFLTADNYPQELIDAMRDLRYWAGLFKNRRSFYWAIALKDSDRLIGTIGFNTISTRHAKADISYDLNSDFWNQGIMSKALGAVLEFADTQLNLVRIQATVTVHNINSIKLLEKYNFVQERRMRKFEMIRNIPTDYYMYGKCKVL